MYPQQPPYGKVATTLLPAATAAATNTMGTSNRNNPKCTLQQQHYPPQQQPQYQPQYAPPQSPGQYAPPQPQSQQPQYAPPQQQSPPPATTQKPPTNSSVDDRDANPFGPGKLPKVTPVTHAMRLQRATAVVKRAEAKKSAAAASSGDATAPSADASDDSAHERKALQAMNEHNYPQIPYMDNLGDHEARFGSGILYYFSFNRFLFILCIVFCVFQCISFGNYIREHSPDFGLSRQHHSWRSDLG